MYTWHFFLVEIFFFELFSQIDRESKNKRYVFFYLVATLNLTAQFAINAPNKARLNVALAAKAQFRLSTNMAFTVQFKSLTEL